MKVSRSAYYAWKNQTSHQLSDTKLQMEQQVKHVFNENKGRYGSRRITHTLAKEGTKISRYKAAGVLRKFALRAIQPRSFVPKTTDSRHSYAISPNLLVGRHWPQRINQVWVSDITYIPLKDNRWCYLSFVMDLISRKIVGWQLLDNLKEQLVIDALQKAIRKRRNVLGLIVHSDRGGQYGSKLYRGILQTHEINQSMSDADNPYDNAFMESCFSRLKAELVGNNAYQTIENARAAIFEYIEGYYNRTRLHSGLGYNSPEEYEHILENKLPSENTINPRFIIPLKIKPINSQVKQKEGVIY
jgi:transposase InsO family protein